MFGGAAVGLMVEVLEWARLGMHTKPVGLLDTVGYYRQLLLFFDHVAASGFCTIADRERLLSDADPGRLLALMRAYRGPAVERWWAA